MKYSILYVADGQVFRIGPFATTDEAMSAANKAQETGELDISDQRVYLLQGHDMIELSMSDFVYSQPETE